MNIPYPGLEPAIADEAPEIIADPTDCLGSYERFVLFGALHEGIPNPSHVGYSVYAVLDEVLVFTQVAWCDRDELSAEERRRVLLRHATEATVDRLETEAFALGDVYLKQVM